MVLVTLRVDCKHAPLEGIMETVLDNSDMNRMVHIVSRRIEIECNGGHQIALQQLTQTSLFTSLMRRPNRGGDFPERTRQSPPPNPLPHPHQI
ncbi:unnamed protein product [Sphenostylis stenocarpa]|uniref:Uncharacterized protein n=1 Tax=Sphenostylis stenocarpa TaxID=92480 RepID=A0AA87B9H3_9FABA|nr:unnamed protein product [Sphenostylis stenocarpa]